MKIKAIIEQARENYKIEKFTDEDLDLQHLMTLPADNYWVMMNMIPMPTQQAIYNFAHGVYFDGFISKKCAKNHRKIKDCKECIHYFTCLDLGYSWIIKDKKD